MENNFYRKKYLIALYDENDQIFAVADNISELIGFLSIPINRDLFVCLIPMEEEKEEELWELGKK